MAYSFDEIMAYHPDNKDVYNELKRALPQLVPFVGAGLTQFAYYSWPGALKQLSSKVTNEDDAERVTSLTGAGRYLDAAQLLEDLRTPANLARDLAALFSADKLEQRREQLCREPAALLPLLFPELVLTTNFDETLETVYREAGRSFQAVSHPGHEELYNQFIRRQGGARGLFKLHGTLTGGLVEYSKIVFTQAQYDTHYGPDSPLPQDLKEAFRNRIMFFLGCSLESDRTMELLQEVIQPGAYHYTILDCEKPRRDGKIRQLGAMHIRAILYEKGRHEAVRVILEHLLEELDPNAYAALPFHVGALRSIDLSERFSYKAEIVPFTGREGELRELNGFLGGPDIAFRWWAVTGPGGCGKSRLAYEFQKQLPAGWTARYLGAGDYADLSSLTDQLTGKTLLIADYVQEHARAIGAWMEQLNGRKRSLPVRVLLVERDSGCGQDNSAWTRQLYGDIHHEQKLKNACFREEFLTLQPLLDGDLLEIIGNYASALKQDGVCAGAVLAGETKRLLLQKLKAVDPGLCRPLYAMFLTDAYVAGQNPEQWNRNDILDYVTTREQKRIKFNMQQALGRPDEKLYTACLYLQSMATVLQDASMEDLAEFCPDAWQVVQEKAEAFVSPADLLEQTGLAVREAVPALRPDLIGEYFVYTWLGGHPADRRRFLSAAWRKPAPTVVFLDRLFHDYGYLLNEDARRWGWILPDGVEAPEESAPLYAMLLVNATSHCGIAEECGRQAGLLEKTAAKYPESSEFAVMFAQGLFNLSNKQDEQGARRTVERLERLAEQYPAVPEVADAFANGLVNLSAEQDEQGAQRTVERLEHLADQYPAVPEITAAFAKSLVNLSAEQDEQGAQRTVERLERLADQYPAVPEIAIEFAKGLFNLIVKQDEQGTQRTVERLEHLADQYPATPEIVTEFANGLVNLSVKQNEQGALRTVERLEHLADQYPAVPEITAAFAKSLVNLSAKQDEQGALRTVERLEHLADQYPAVPEITAAFARGLFNLSTGQDEQGAQRTVERLERLADQYPAVPKIATEFAQGLVNLSATQDGQEAQRTIDRLERLAGQYPAVPEIAIVFAQGLVNLSHRQDEQAAQLTMRKAIEVLQRFKFE